MTGLQGDRDVAAVCSSLPALMPLTACTQRQHFFGRNRIPAEPSQSIWAIMWEAVQDPTLIILIVAAIVSLVFGLTLSDFDQLEWVEGYAVQHLPSSASHQPCSVAILVSVAIVVLVASFNDYQKEKQFKALQASQDEQKLIEVVRDGQLLTISHFDLVVRSPCWCVDSMP